jgi:hypothetical protein
MIASDTRGPAAARVIMEITDDLQNTVHHEVGRLMAQGIDSVIAILDPLYALFMERPLESRVISTARNQLTILRKGYAEGSLPRRSRHEKS